MGTTIKHKPKRSLPLKHPSMLDGRCGTARRFRRLVLSLKRASPLPDGIAKDIHVERAAMLTMAVESAEYESMHTGKLDRASYVAMCNQLLGVLRTLELRERAREVKRNRRDELKYLETT